MANEDLAQAVQEVLEEISEIRQYDFLKPDDSDSAEMKRDVLRTRVRKLHKKYGSLLKDTPEGYYLSELVEFYARRPDDEIYTRKVTELGFNTRTLNCLEKHKIIYVGQLVQLSMQKILHFKNFGVKSFAYLQNVLEEHELELGTVINFVPPETEE